MAIDRLGVYTDFRARKALERYDPKVARLNVDEIVDARFVDRLKQETGAGK